MKFCYHCMTQLPNKKLNICPTCGQPLKRQPNNGRYLPPGTILKDKYVVGDPLGAGGFGITYIGWDLLLLRKIAIKEFYPEQYSKRHADGITLTVIDENHQKGFEKGLQYFLKEARSVASLQDIKGVVQISNYFEANGTGYIVMEYLEGMDVKHILKLAENNGRTKNYEWCRKVILTVLYTLREVHARGVIHRDIAPDNVFITSEGIIKLIDFGAAKHDDPLIQENTAVIVKSGYAPIEQYGRNLNQGTYTDMYAIAALFYRMLVGKHPAPAIDRLAKDDVKAPSELGIRIPKNAELAIMVCLNLQPEYRLQTADEFIEALDGRYFVPDYEPEWILPEIKNRDISKKSKKEQAFTRRWLIGMTACAAVALCVGGAAVYRSHSRNSANSVATDEISMPDLTGMSEKKAKHEITSLNEDYGWDISFEKSGSVYNKDAEDSTVCVQSLSVGSVLNPELDKGEKSVNLYETGNTSDNEDYELIWNGRKLSGTIYYEVQSNEKIYYSELQGLNAIAIAQKLGGDEWINDDEKFVREEDENEKHNYWDLCKITLIDGTKITGRDLEKAQESDSIKVADIKSITYYASNFIYIKKLDDYVGKKVSELPKFDLYSYDKNDESKRVCLNKKYKVTGSSNLVDYSYYSFTKQDGTIVEQNVAAGKTYDGSDKSTKTAALFGVVKHQLSYSGTGTQVREALKEELGYSDSEYIERIVYGSGSSSQSVTSVTISNKDGEVVDYFSEGDKDTITITLNCASAPVKKSSGSSSSSKSPSKSTSDTLQVE